MPAFHQKHLGIWALWSTHCMVNRLQLSARTFTAHLKVVLVLVAVMWLLEIIDTLVLGQFLNSFGIRPRSSIGLLGIVLAPFLHGGLAHLVANTLPFAVLALLILARDRDEFVLVTLVVWVVSGLGVWLIGPPLTVHVGVSGIIFGYLGFLLLRGLFDGKLSSILIAIGVGIAYGGVLWGVLPLEAGVSWQGHLFGFIGGGIAARLVA